MQKVPTFGRDVFIRSKTNAGVAASVVPRSLGDS